MILSGPPQLDVRTDTQNYIKEGFVDEDDIEHIWTNKISKHIVTNTTFFEIEYMSYTKWRPDTISWPEIVNSGCGNLKYDISYRSWRDAWGDAWEDNDIM